MSPFQFEIKNDDGSLSFVRVVNTFEHYYTRETMRSIRIDSLKDYSVHGVTEWKIVNEEEFAALLERRKIDGQT